MSDARTRGQRRADVLATLERCGDAFLATASPTGAPHLIAVSIVWTGNEIVIATRATSPTARNLADRAAARLALGSPEDVIMLDVEVQESAPAAPGAALARVFVPAAGWDPADEGPDWRYFRLRPVRIQAYRGYGELAGRDVMRDGRWLA